MLERLHMVCVVSIILEVTEFCRVKPADRNWKRTLTACAFIIRVSWEETFGACGGDISTGSIAFDVITENGNGWLVAVGWEININFPHQRIVLFQSNSPEVEGNKDENQYFDQDRIETCVSVIALWHNM